MDQVLTIGEWLKTQTFDAGLNRRQITESDCELISTALKSASIYEVAKNLGFSYGTVKRIARQ